MGLRMSCICFLLKQVTGGGGDDNGICLHPDSDFSLYLTGGVVVRKFKKEQRENKIAVVQK